MDKIRNKVKESGLITMDLAEFKPSLGMIGIDIADQLWQGLALKEKDFRAWVKDHDWHSYSGEAVFVHCSADAIIPTWAFMLIGSKLEEAGVSYIIGNADELTQRLILDQIQNIELTDYVDGRVIIKGCSDIPNPEFAMSELVRKLQPVVKSIMYGEPCSTVPIFKRKG